MSAGSNIYPEFGIPALTTKYISRDLFPFVGGTASTQCFLGASFSGKKASVGYSVIGGAGYDAGFGIAVDSTGNVYVSGNYSSLVVGPVSINTFGTVSTATGVTLPTSVPDAFVIKWNPNGTLARYTTLGGDGGDSVSSVAADSTGNVYVTGYYQGTGTVPIKTFGNPQTASGVSMPATTGSSDAFVIKWNPNGTLAGYSNIKGTGADAGNRIAVDSGGNIYIAGQYLSTITAVPINTFGTAPAASGVSMPATSSNLDAFVIKWNANGTLAGYSNIKGTGYDTAKDIAVDSGGNIYIAGYYLSTGTVPINTFGTAPAASGFSMSATTNNLTDAFVIKWNANGTLAGYSMIKGTGGDSANGIAVDSGGNIYVTGYYTSSTAVPINTFGTAPVATGVSLPAGNDVFVIKWNANGTLAGYSTFGSGQGDTANSIAVDSGGNIYITGQYISATTVPIKTFGTAPAASGVSMPAGSGEFFVMKWNANGTLAGYSTFGSASIDAGNRIAVDSGGKIYVTGQYFSTTTVPIKTFGTAPAATVVSLPATVDTTSGSDAFVIKWQP
jgi:hypothetical protein